MNMLPVSPWTHRRVPFAHQIIPSLYLSGDFVDYFRVDERRVAFYLADVSGHGASSAFVTVLLKFMTTRLLFESKRNGTLPEFKPSARARPYQPRADQLQAGQARDDGRRSDRRGDRLVDLQRWRPFAAAGVLHAGDRFVIWKGVVCPSACSMKRPTRITYIDLPPSVQSDADVRRHSGPFARRYTQRKRSDLARTGQGGGRQPGWAAPGVWIGHARGDAG